MACERAKGEKIWKSACKLFKKSLTWSYRRTYTYQRAQINVGGNEKAQH